MASDAAARDAELAFFVPLLSGSALVALYETVRQTDAYLGPGLAAPRSAAVSLLLLAFAFGAWLGRRWLLATARRTTLLVRLTAALACACAAAGPLWFHGFQTSGALSLVGYGVPAVSGLLSGALIGAVFQASALAYRELGALGRVLGPLPLLSGLVLALVCALGLSHAGLWRAGAVVGLGLAGLSLLLGRYGPYFSDRLEPPRRPATVALTASALSLAVAQAFVPSNLVARYPSEVVWAAGDDASLVVTSGQNTLRLFEAGQLRLSSVDAYRLAESTVHPALSAAPRRERVLLFGPAGGFLEREVLRYPDVMKLVSVAEQDGARFRQTSWPRESHGELDDPRLRFEVAEPLPWLEEHAERFDAIVVSLPLPADYIQGKHYTRHFYAALAEHLLPRGVLVVQAVSRATLPATFAGIRETLQSAGLLTRTYEAPIPLQGAVSFVIATRGPRLRFDAGGLPPGLRYLDAGALERGSLLGGPETNSEVPITTLDQQHVVESWHQEWSALGE